MWLYRQPRALAYDATSVPGQPLLTTVTGPSGCQTGYHYNGQAQLIEIIDPNGYSTSCSYDGLGRIASRRIAELDFTL